MPVLHPSLKKSLKLNLELTRQEQYLLRTQKKISVHAMSVINFLCIDFNICNPLHSPKKETNTCLVARTYFAKNGP